MRTILFILTLFFSIPSFSQTAYYGVSEENAMPQNEKFKDSERSKIMKRNIKEMRGSIGSSQDTIRARNLLLLKEIIDFKIQEATLAAEIEKLKQNREFNTKLLKALNQLDNRKFSDRENQEVMDILNNAGNRLYNSLAN
jgi:hypothetical protein